MILVSSCLAGNPVRYDGKACLDNTIQQLIAEKKAVAVCPEVLGGLSTPREPAEIVGGDGYDVLAGTAKVIAISGTDVTAEFIDGALKTLQIAQQMNVTQVVLKEDSPSCGSNKIYSGQHDGGKIVGVGVTTALLATNGIKVISEFELEALKK